MTASQVFLSHTSDMAQFPEPKSFVRAAVDAVIRAGMAPVEMRHFPARDGLPADYCRERVRECEIYLAVVGFRYGSLVPGEAVSYTELEFRAATAAGMPRLVFLLADASSLPPAMVDADLGQVEGFRQRLRDAGLIVRSFTPDSLEVEVFHALRDVADRGTGLVRREVSGVLPVMPPSDQLRRLMARQPVRLAPRPVFLAGRDELLAELDARLSVTTGTRIVALCGMGGAGKTSTAVEYAHCHLLENEIVWQLAAENPTVLAAGFSELAVQLGAGEVPDAGDPVTWVHGVLAARPGDWLLIFDNAPGLAGIQAVLPPAGGGRVLITSQNAIWPAGQALDVPVLDQKMSVAFLQERSGATDSEAVRDLAGEIGGLPLALEQASAYIRETGRSTREYLSLYRQRQLDLLARGEPAGYDKTVATTWRLAFDQLQDSAPRAIGLLRLLACCAPEDIPVHRLLGMGTELAGVFDPEVEALLLPLLTDPVAADDAVLALRRYSLTSPPHEGTVTVHRLVQAVTLSQLSAEDAAAWRRAAGSLIEAALPDDPHQPANWPTCAALLPHAQAALAPGSDGMQKLGIYLLEAGNYAASFAVLQRVLDAREEELGAEYPRTLATRIILAGLTGTAGDRAAARDQYATLLPVMERVLGPEHPDTLAARGEFAFWTGQAGAAAAARDQYTALLPVLQLVLGPEHSETLLARSELAAWTGHAGNPAAARDQFDVLLPVLERVLGPEHPETLTSRANHAFWTGYAGDAASARDLYAALLPSYGEVFGLEHPYTVTVRANVARWTGHAGNAAAARDQYAALLAVRERVSGPEHPSTLTDRMNLAWWTGAAGDPAGARDQCADLLPVLEKVSGPAFPITLTVRGGLARWTGEAGDAAGARDQYAALLPIREKVSGPDHPDTLTVRAGLAHWKGRANRRPRPGSTREN